MQGIIWIENKPEIYSEEKCFITEILNSEDYPDVSVAQVTVKVGVTTVLHKLIETDEKYYILKGIGEMEIDGKIVGNVQSGEMIIIPRNITQRIKNIGSDDLVFLCICTPRFEFNNYEAVI